MTVFIRIYKIDNICSYYFILLRLTMRSLFCDVTLSNTCSIIIQEYVFTWNCNFTVNFLIFAFSFYMLQKKRNSDVNSFNFSNVNLKIFTARKSGNGGWTDTKMNTKGSKGDKDYQKTFWSASCLCYYVRLPIYNHGNKYRIRIF